MTVDTEKLVILGSGPAGLTAGLYAARANLSPIIIDGEDPGGQLMSTSYIENWPGEVSVTGPDLMKQIREHVSTYSTRFVQESIVHADLSQRPFVLTTSRHRTIKTHALIIATGAQPKKLGCVGESTYWGKGVTSCAVCDGAFYKNLPVIVVGGGDTAMENASFLTNFTKKITIVHILPQLTASHSMQQRVVDNPDIQIIYSSTISAIEGDGRKITQVTITDQNTQQSYVQETRGLFVSIGIIPNTQLFKNQLAMNTYGYLLPQEHTHASIPGVFLAGDAADSRYRQAITSAGTGCAAALDAERYLKEQGL